MCSYNNQYLLAMDQNFLFSTLKVLCNPLHEKNKSEIYMHNTKRGGRNISLRNTCLSVLISIKHRTTKTQNPGKFRDCEKDETQEKKEEGPYEFSFYSKSL